MRTAHRIAASVGSAAALLLVIVTSSGFATRNPNEWSPEELGVIASLSLAKLPPAPKDPSNAVDGKPAAVALGRRLFEDRRFSRDQTVSCASCHSPDKQFQDGLPVGRGVGVGTRRAMPVVDTGHNAWFFWDGRKDSLWAQALGPLEDAVEHGGNRTRYARLLQAHYKADYEALFGSMPSSQGLPADAGPLGNPDEQAAWQSMPASKRVDVNRVFANMGKAIAAYEKSLSYGQSRLSTPDHFSPIPPE